jgi:hypothetical protein
MNAPDCECTFVINYISCKPKVVKVHDWSIGGAWAALCRDLAKQDHGDTNLVYSVVLVGKAAI